MTKNSQTPHKSNSVGHEVALLMHGVENYDVSDLNKFLRTQLRRERFGIEDSIKSDDEIMALLSESHAASKKLKDGTVLWSMYSCRGPKDAKNITRLLIERLDPRDYDIAIDSEVPLTINTAKHRGMFQKALKLPEKTKFISLVYGGMDPARLMNTFELENRFRAGMPMDRREVRKVFPGMGYTFMGVGEYEFMAGILIQSMMLFILEHLEKTQEK